MEWEQKLNEALTFLNEDPYLAKHTQEAPGHFQILKKVQDKASLDDSIEAILKVAKAGKEFVNAGHNFKLDAFMHLIRICAEVVTGPVGELVTDFAAYILTLLSSKGADPGGDLLVGKFKELLEQYQKESFVEDVNGWFNSYNSANQTLIGVENHDELEKDPWHDVIDRAIPNDFGSVLLGRMSKFLKNSAMNAKNHEDANVTLDIVNYYCEIIFCRADLLIRKYRLFSKMGSKDVAPVLENIKGIFSNEEGRKLEFLFTPVTPHGALVAAAFTNQKQSTIHEFLTMAEVKPPTFTPTKPQYPMVQMYKDAYYKIGDKMSKEEVLTKFTRIGQQNHFKMEAYGKEKEVQMIVTVGPKPLCLLACPENPSTFLKVEYSSDKFQKLPESHVPTDFFFTLVLEDEQGKQIHTSELNEQSKEMFHGLCTLL